MAYSTRPTGGRTALQVTLGVLAAIPLASGAAGMLAGPGSLPGGTGALTATQDSEYRFTNAFWCASSAVIWWTLPRVEQPSPVLRATMATIVLGGVARLRSWQVTGRPHATMTGALALELVGVPALWAWQRHVAHAALASALTLR